MLRNHGLLECPSQVEVFVRRVSSLIAIVCCVMWGGSVAARSRSVWDGTYTKAQAARGKAVYDETCRRCHGETLLGGDDAAPLVGDEFLQKWNGKALWKLFDVMRRTMPSDGPAILTRAQCADLVAFLLTANDIPAGPSELASDDPSLNDIVFGPRPGGTR